MRRREEENKSAFAFFLFLNFPSLLFHSLSLSLPKHPRRLAKPVGPLHLLPAGVVQVAVEEQAVVGLACFVVVVVVVV